MLDEAGAYIEQGDFAAADEILLSVLRQDADNGVAWLYRGQLFREHGDLDLAMEAWRQVPDSPETLGGTARFMEATVLLESNEARGAEQKLLRAIELNPTYVQPHERLLALYVLQMRGPETIQRLDRIQKLRALSLDELVLRARAGEQITDAEQAMGILQAFIATDREDTASRVSWPSI